MFVYSGMYTLAGQGGLFVRFAKEGNIKLRVYSTLSLIFCSLFMKDYLIVTAMTSFAYDGQMTINIFNAFL